MAKSFYTLIIVPHAGSKLHKLRFPVRVVYLLAAIGVVSFLVAVTLGFNYTKMAFRTADYNKLQTENQDLKIQKKNLEVSTLKLNTRLNDLESLSVKLTELVEKNNSWNKKLAFKVSIPALGGSKVDYSTADLVHVSRVIAGMDSLKDRTADLESQLKLLEQVAEKRAAIIRYTPTEWPVHGRVTSPYGHRTDPFDGGGEMHLGIDIGALYGTPVHSPADGIVVFANRKAAYGNLIVIDHGNGITTRDGHLSRFNVHAGERVRKNEIIGYVGSTGRSTAPHLHYEVRVHDHPVNPRRFLP